MGLFRPGFVVPLTLRPFEGTRTQPLVLVNLFISAIFCLLLPLKVIEIVKVSKKEQKPKAISFPAFFRYSFFFFTVFASRTKIALVDFARHYDAQQTEKWESRCGITRQVASKYQIPQPWKWRTREAWKPIAKYKDSLRRILFGRTKMSSRIRAIVSIKRGVSCNGSTHPFSKKGAILYQVLI